MNKLSLYIKPSINPNIQTGTEEDENFHQVDLMEEELISVTSVIKDVRDLDKLFTDFSRQFNLPSSKSNNKIFKHWYNPDVDYFDCNKFADARIFLNHQPFKEGKIQLNSVTMRNNKASIYKITFFGNVSDFSKKIKDTELSDLEWLNNFNHQATDTGVRAGLESGITTTVDGVTYTKGVTYPLLAHSQAFLYSDTTEQSNGMNLSTNGSNTDRRGVCPEDLKPAIRASIIIKAIENYFGITFKTGKYPHPINGDDLFFSSTAFTDLYMWLHREKGKMATGGYYVANQPSDYTNTSGDTELLPSPAGTASTTSGYGYFSTGTGIFYLRMTDYRPHVQYKKNQFRYKITITPSGGFTSTQYDLQILNGKKWSVISEKKNISGTQSVTFETGFDAYGKTNPIESYQQYFDADPFSFVPVTYRLISEGSIQFGAEIEVTRNVNYIYGSTTETFEHTLTATNSSTTLTPQEALVTITDNVPKIKVRDFLSGLFKTFNLVAHIEELTGEIIVQTLDQYYSQGEQIDITKYIHTDTHEISSVIPYSDIEFKYKEPKSILAEQHNQLFNKQYGELSYTANSDTSNQYNFEAPFEHMKFERLFNLGTTNLTTLQTGSFLNQDLKASIGAPVFMYCINRNIQSDGNRINFIESTRSSDTLGALMPVATTVSSLNTYIYPSNTNEAGTSTTAPAFCLHFGSAVDEFNFTDYGGNNNSLFQLYYQNYITRVFNRKARMFSMTATLPLEILVRLTLNDLIVVGTRAFTINKMTTKLQSGETTFELLNVPDYDVFDTNIQMNYSTSRACQNASDLTPTFSPSGGTFTST